MTKFIGIISGKGGVGKTTTAINLTATLLGFGRSAILVDGDLSGSNIALHLGLPLNERTLHTVLKNKHSMRESIYKHPSGLFVIPGSVSYDHFKDVNLERLPDALLDLVGHSEVVVVDSSSGYGVEMKAVLKAVDYVIIVTTPDMIAVAEALKSCKLAQEQGKTILGVLVNRVRNEETEMTWQNVQTVLGVPVIGVMPEDDAVRLSQYLKNPVVYTHPTSNLTRAFKFLAARLIGEQYHEELPAVHEEHKQHSLGYYVLKNLGFVE